MTSADDFANQLNSYLANRDASRNNPNLSDGGDFQETIIEDLEDAPWDDDDHAWGICTLGPHKLPGLATVKPESSRKLDIKPVPGADGGTTTDKGYEGGKVAIELVMWLKSHREALIEILPIIHPRKPGKTREAYDITHPSATLHGIRSVMVQKIRGPEQGSIPGTKQLTIECVEWMPTPKTKKSVTATPKNAASSSGSYFPVDPKATPAFGRMSKGNSSISPAPGMSKP